MAINIGGGYHSKDKQGRPRSGEKVDELLDKIEDAKIENGTISIGGRSITPITEHQDISGKANVGDSYTKSESDNKYSTKQELSGKQDVIDDLQAIRSGAALGATAYQKPSTGIPASDIAEGVIPDVPTNVSAFTNDAGYLTEHQSLDDYYTKTQVDNALDAKADTADLADVATSGDYDDLSNKPSLFSGDYNDLTNKPTIPAAQVNSDWNATGGVAEILNKPTIPAEQIQSDWEQNDSSAKDYIKNKPNYAGSQSAGGAANKAVSIPFGQVDSTSTSTAFTATVDGITELRDGVCVYLRNGKETSASGWTLNINNLGAKPVYTTMSAASASTTQFNVNYTMLFVYNSTRVSEGCWDMFYGYYSDANTIGYDIRDYIARKRVKNVLYSYRFLCTCMDGLLLPVNTDNGTIAATHILTKESFNPWGQIYYYSSTTTVNAGSITASGTLYTQATYIVLDLRYSFNTASTLVANNDIYIKCLPQPDGSAILADDAIVFALPTYEDGFIYKRLGKAYDTYRIILEQDKPVYYYKDGIKLWTGYNLQEGVMVTDEFTKKDSGVTSDVRVKSVGGKTVVWNQLHVSDYTTNSTSYISTFRTLIESDTKGNGVFSKGTARGYCLLSCSGNIESVEGHKYLSHVRLKSTHSGSVYIGCLNNTVSGRNNFTQKVELTANEYLDCSYITPAYVENTNYNSYARLRIGFKFDEMDSNAEITFKDLYIIDLTQMFGTGNEPSTVEEFEAMFPEDSYAYDAGRIVNVAMTGMKSIDADGNDLDSAELDVTTLTGVADGGSTSEIIFPNGMNGIGDVRDEIDLVNGRAVKRIGVVDLGTLTWDYSTLYDRYRFIAQNTTHIIPENTSVSARPNMLCQSIEVVPYAYFWNTIANDPNSEEKALTCTYNSGILVHYPDTTDATTFATAMSGVMLYYELDTPIEYTLDTTPSCVMSVVKGGKEMILPYNASEPQCAPVRIVEEYKMDYVSNKVVKSLEDRIAALEAIINNG